MRIEPSNMVIVAILNSILQFYPYDRGIYTSFTSAVRKNKVSKAPQDFYRTVILEFLFACGFCVIFECVVICLKTSFSSKMDSCNMQKTQIFLFFIILFR